VQAFAQKKNPSDFKPEDVRKMIEQKKKEIQEDKNMSPAEKEKILHLLDQANNEKRSDTKADESQQRPTNTISKKARLAGISQKILTDVEVKNLVLEMIKKLEPQIPPSENEFVNNAVDKSGGNSVALSNMAVAAWYTGHGKAALIAALKAATLQHPEAALNNVAAILNLSGYEEKAVPVLLNLLSKYPDNSDNDQQPTDIRMKGEIKSSVGAGVTSETGQEYTMGMNSGIDVSVTQGARSFKL
jgi:hypothetical protein